MSQIEEQRLAAEAEQAKAWAESHRDGMTYGDIRDALSSAVAAKFQKKDDDWSYVQDFTDDWVVFSCNSVTNQAPYTIDGSGIVTLGKATPVTATTVTSYTPVDTKSADEPPQHRSPITLKRAFTSLLEQPPARDIVELQIRSADTTGVANFSGYASTVDTPYPVADWLGEYSETIRSGAFDKTLREQSVPLLFNHDGMPIARYNPDTDQTNCRLTSNKRGLLTEADLDRRQGLVNDLCIALERRDVCKMSFAFRSVKEDWNDSYDERSVNELALYDVSIVTNPANPATSAELRQSMRSLLGREGTSIMWSVRTALDLADRERVAEQAEPLIDKAIRGLSMTDEIMCRQYGNQGRARTFAVAGMLLDVRAGAVLSEPRELMLRAALAALNDDDDAAPLSADDIDDALRGKKKRKSSQPDKTGAAVNDDGKSGDGGGSNNSGSGNVLSPADGAGPRSLKTVEETRRILEKLRHR